MKDLKSKEERSKREREKKEEEWNEGTYSRRAVVIGGNFIILRHYPRYCNAIKLDTLRTPCRNISGSFLLRVSSFFHFLHEDVGTLLALLRSISHCPNNFTRYIYMFDLAKQIQKAYVSRFKFLCLCSTCMWLTFL